MDTIKITLQGLGSGLENFMKNQGRFGFYMTCPKVALIILVTFSIDQVSNSPWQKKKVKKGL